MRQRIQPILDLIDEGLWIYRRGFVGFTLLALLWLAPIAVGIGLSLALAEFAATGVIELIIVGWLLLAFPLLIYLIAALSRATSAVQAGESIRLARVLALSPLRLAGMGCYGLVFLIFAGVVMSTFSTVCLCPLYLGVVFAFSAGAAVFGQAGALGGALGTVLIFAMLILSVLLYALSLVLNGAAYSSLVYALQPFVERELTLGAAMQRSIDLVFYRIGQNALAFLTTSLVFGALTVAVTIAVGVLLPLPLGWLLGVESPVVQGVSASAWLLGLALVLPPLPIWMLLLYQRNLAAREGSDLARRIDEVFPVNP